MQGLGWLLFSFRGAMIRSEFLCAIIISSVGLGLFYYALNYLNAKYVLPMIIDFSSLKQGSVNIEASGNFEEVANQLQGFSKLILASLVPTFIAIILHFWISLAIYIKRYRDIGIPAYATILLLLLVYIIPYVHFLKVMNFSFLSLTSHLGALSFVLFFYGVIAFILSVYIFVPLFWPGRKI